MADDQDTAGEAEQGIFQGPEGVHVQVVRGLVQEEDVAPFLQELGQVQAVPLPAGEHTHGFLLVRTPEVEPGEVGPGVHLGPAEMQHVGAGSHLLEHRLLTVQILTGLVHVGQLHGLSHLQRPPIRLLFSHDHPEEGRLARPVCADDAHDGPGGNVEGEVLHEKAVPVSLLQAVGPDHRLAQTRPLGDEDLRRPDLLPLVGTQEVLVGVDPGLPLGMPGPRRHAHPLQLPLQSPLPGALLLLLNPEPLPLLLQPGGVVALPWNPPPPVQLQDPLGHVVQEVAIVGDGHHGPRVLGQVPLQPGHGLGIQVVRGLVQQQHVRSFQEHPAEGHPPPFPSGQGRHVRISRRKAEGVHGHLQLPVQVPGVGGLNAVLEVSLLLHEGVHLLVGAHLGEGHAHGLEADQELPDLPHRQLHVPLHVQVGIQLRLLGQVPDARPLRRPGFPEDVLVQSGHDSQEGALSRAVRPHDPDLRPGEEGKADVLQDLPLRRDDLGQPVHVVDELLLGHDEERSSPAVWATWFRPLSLAR